MRHNTSGIFSKMVKKKRVVSPRAQPASQPRQRARAGVPAGVSTDLTANPLPPWPVLTTQAAKRSPVPSFLYVHKKVEASPSTLFIAIARAMEHEDRQAHRTPPTLPSCRVETCREFLIGWMRANTSVSHPLLGNMTPSALFSLMYHNTNLVLNAAHGRNLKPTTWNEYLHHMLSEDTEADELAFKCAVLCFQTRIIVTVVSTGVHTGSHLLDPPQPQRRIHLLFDSTRRRWSWVHPYKK